MIPIGDDREDIISQFVHEWISLLAARGFEEALRQIDEPNSDGRMFNPFELELAVGKSLLAVPIHQFESLGPKGISANVMIVELMEGVMYAAHYHLPPYQEWDSLTISLNFLERSGRFAVSLEIIQ